MVHNNYVPTITYMYDTLPFVCVCTIQKENDINKSDIRRGRGTRPSPLKNGMIFEEPAANLTTAELSVYEFGDKEGTPLRNHPFPTSPKGFVRNNFVSEGERSTATDDEIEFDINLSF